MASYSELLARRIVRDAQAYTGGKAGQWAMLHAIVRRLALKDNKAIDGAVLLAQKKGWLELGRDHSFRLTDAGRRLAMRASPPISPTSLVKTRSALD
jgi:hypothetical protein